MNSQTQDNLFLDMKAILNPIFKTHIGIVLLTICSAILIFYRIGNTSGPVSFYEMGDDNNEIILDLGEYVEVSSVDIFLGHLNDRIVSLSSFDEENQTWNLISENATLKSVFCWNSLKDINQPIRYIGLVLMEGEASFGEMIVVDKNDHIITPVNANEYPELFDEQNVCSSKHSYLDGTIFDEVYHARTAYEFIHAYDTYETTHPHLGKILISLGIRMFGMTPFGWRFMSAVFGILMIPLFYVFALLLFDKNIFISFISASLLSLDFMHYALSRIATIDIIAAFFILASFTAMYAFIKYEKMNYLVLSAMAISCAISTKWTGLYAGLGLAIVFFIYFFTKCTLNKKKLFLICIPLFVLLPVLIYSVGFIPVVDGNGSLIEKIINGSKYMFSYHSGVTEEHPYSSRFYQWPYISRPLLYAFDVMGENSISVISLLGNPVLYWSGIICVVLCAVGISANKTASYYLLVGYLTSYVPWFFISRTTFIYHYFPSSIFMIMMIASILYYVYQKQKYGKAICIAYVALVAIVFILYFPVISGLPMTREYGSSLQLMQSWVMSY